MDENTKKMEENIINLLRNTAISSGNTIVIAGILVSLITGKILGFIFSGSVLISAIINTGLKHGFKAIESLLPINIPLKRPSISKKGCGISIKCLPNVNDNPDEQGMPSGHSQTATFAATFWILYIWRYMRHTKSYNVYYLWPATIIIGLLGLLIIISRSFLVENCHTIAQIFVGGIIGIGLAILFYWLIEKYVPQWFGEPLNSKDSNNDNDDENDDDET